VERTGCAYTPAATAIEAVDSAGRVWGMVLFDGWTPNGVQLHVAVDAPVAWLSLVRPMFQYVFEQCSKGVLWGLVLGNNRRSLRLAKGLGFVEADRVRDGWALGVDLVRVEMRKENCRWLLPARKAA
jgi:hypothetical protein